MSKSSHKQTASTFAWDGWTLSRTSSHGNAFPISTPLLPLLVKTKKGFLHNIIKIWTKNVIKTPTSEKPGHRGNRLIWMLPPDLITEDSNTQLIRSLRACSFRLCEQIKNVDKSWGCFIMMMPEWSINLIFMKLLCSLSYPQIHVETMQCWAVGDEWWMQNHYFMKGWLIIVVWMFSQFCSVIPGVIELF